MLELITQPVRKELEAFDRLYREALRTPVSDFQFMLDFISGKKGKRIRPLVLILSAKLCGEATPETLKYAVILELLHTATLIHDDVVDDTRERRGQPSVMAQFDNRRAVLLGDYILSQAIVQGVGTNNPRVLNILAGLAQTLAEGELTQLIASSEISIDEQRYFEVIRKKTAMLLASCSEMGAISVGADAEKTEILRTIGNNLGLCFQLKDDVFDYFEKGELGKPTGNDIREGKITLPLIYALRAAPEELSAPLMAVIRKRDFSSANIKRLIDFAKTYRGIEYAYEKMQQIKTETLELLAQFPHSEAGTAMIRMIDYIIERKR
ncbi:MAG: polyprenyl synthetase family protein [Dysgonamonadaceae bacterium]|jgi:octaprenyl-diphosphate synthase|nr:polyprenyl synthetase family protein [Dysgonamonadaceae bacterium]